MNMINILTWLVVTILAIQVQRAQSNNCFGYQSVDVQVCNNRIGNCTAKNECKCPSNYAGRKCTFKEGDEYAEMMNVVGLTTTTGYTGKMTADNKGNIFYAKYNASFIGRQDKGLEFSVYAGKIGEEGNVNDRGIYARFSKITDIDILADSRIIVVDAGVGRVKVIDPDDLMVSYYIDKEYPYLQEVVVDEYDRVYIKYGECIDLLEPVTQTSKRIYGASNCNETEPSFSSLQYDQKLGTINFIKLGKVFLVPLNTKGVNSDIAYYGSFGDAIGNSPKFTFPITLGIDDRTGHNYIWDAIVGNIKELTFNPGAAQLFVPSVLANYTNIGKTKAPLENPNSDQLLKDLKLYSVNDILVHQNSIYLSETNADRTIRVRSKKLFNESFIEVPNTCYGHPGATVYTTPMYDRQFWTTAVSGMNVHLGCYSSLSVFSISTIPETTIPLNVAGTKKYKFIFTYLYNLCSPGPGTVEVMKTSDNSLISSHNLDQVGDFQVKDFEVNVGYSFYLRVRANTLNLFLVNIEVQVMDVNSTACSGHGTCVGTNKCECQEKYTGLQCEKSSICDYTNSQPFLGENLKSGSLNGASALFNGPSSLVSDANSDLFIVDSKNHAIRLASASGFVSTIAGQSGSPGFVDGEGHLAKFNYPSRITMDDITRTLYVSDRGNHAIRNISVSHQVSTLVEIDNVYELEFMNWGSKHWLFYSTMYQLDKKVVVGYIDMATNTNNIITDRGNGDIPGICSIMSVSPISSLVSKNEIMYFATFSGDIGIIKHINDADCFMSMITKIKNDHQFTRGHMDGHIHYAVFNIIYDMDFIHNSLYIVDGAATVRRLNFDTQTVTTVVGVPNHEVNAVDFSSSKTLNVTSDLYFKKLSSIHINKINEDVYVTDVGTNVIHKIRFDMDPTCSCASWSIGESTCNCDNRRGDKCEYLKYSCYGYDSVEGDYVCTLRGNCTLPDTCQCNSKFQGAQCEKSVCDGSHMEEVTSLADASHIAVTATDVWIVATYTTYFQTAFKAFSHETFAVEYNRGFDKLTPPFLKSGATLSAYSPNNMAGNSKGNISLTYHDDTHNQYLNSFDFNNVEGISIGMLTTHATGYKSQLYDDILIYVSDTGITFFNQKSISYNTWSMPPYFNMSKVRFTYHQQIGRLYISHNNQIFYQESNVGPLLNITDIETLGYRDGLLSQAKFNRILDIELDPIHENSLYILEVATIDTVRLRHLKMESIVSTVFSNQTAYWEHNPVEMRMTLFANNPRLYLLLKKNQIPSDMHLLVWKIESNPACHCANWTVFSNCTCLDGYKGNRCDEAKVKCYGVIETEEEVCSGHGVCEAINQCKCESGWGDYNCHIPKCNGFLASDENVCNGKGSCIDSEVCSCHSGYQTAKYCEPCPLGQYQNGTGFGSAKCLKCDLGYFSNTPSANDSSVCKPCPRHTYADSPGLAVCIPCPSGSFHAPNTTAQKDDTLCISCPAGKYSVGNGEGCQSCIPGTYSTSVGATTSAVCIQCGQGTYSPTPGADSPSTCISCPEGSYSTALGASLLSHCTKCSSGTYSDSGVGQISPSVCKKCPAGTASNIEGATSVSTCSTCQTGTYSPIASDRCIPCAQGTYSDTAGVSNCTICPSGSTTPPPTATKGSTSNTACQTCEAGYFTSQSGVGCVPCPLGTASSQYPAPDPEACIDCVVGTYANSPGSTECEVCKAGYYTPDIRTCLPCPGGYYTDEDKLLSCKPCEIGYFAESGSSSCTACPEGTYSTTPTASSSDVCIPCDSGWVSRPASTNCTICEPGYYADSKQEFCVACQAGSFSPNNASANYTYCIDCPKGTYSGVVGAYQLSQCELCPAGRFNEYTGKVDISSCEFCPSGTFSNVTGAPSIENCKLCSPNTYSEEEGSTQCKSCKSGICPYFGSSGMLQLLENGDTPFSSDINEIYNPQVAESGISVASLVSKYTPVVVLAIVGVITFLVLMILSMCIYGKGNPCLAVQKADIFFTMKHRLNENEARTKKKTCLGGFFSVVAVIIILVLICVSTSDLFFNNIYVSESFTTPKGRTFVNKGDFIGHVYYFGKFDAKCNASHISSTHSGFIHSRDDEVVTKESFKCTQDTKYNSTSDVDSCHCIWTCHQCTLDGVKQNVEFKAPGIMTSVIGYDFRVPHFIENSHYILNGSIQAGGSSLFYGTKATTLFLNLFNTIYTAQPGIMAPAVNLFPFFQGAAQKELNGLQSQLQSVSTGDRLTGSNPTVFSSDSNFQGVSVGYQMEISSFVFLLEEQLRQSTLNFFAQISALSSMVLAIVTVLLGVTEALVSNYYAIIDKRKKLAQKRKEKKSTTKPDWLKETEYRQDEYIKCPPTPSANSLTNELTDEAPGEGGGGFDSMPPFMVPHNEVSQSPSNNTPQTPKPFLTQNSKHESTSSSLPPFMM